MNALFKESKALTAYDGFTATDLLVTVGSVCVLALFLLPAQAHTRSSSTATGCRANLEQIGRALQMYAGDNAETVAAPNQWFTVGPYINVKGFACGPEWKGTGVNLSANTPAPLLVNYLPNNFVWVCPLRKRGLTYATQPGEYDPSITGFLSYGFNQLRVFATPDPSGNMVNNGKKMKFSGLARPAETIAILDVSGGNDPSGTATSAAFLDTIWLGLSGPDINAYPNNNSFNYRVQTAFAKHNKQLNVLYTDGHVKASHPSALTWGQFAGVFEPGVLIPSASGVGHNSDQFISSQAYDSVEWSSAPE